jgi:hypothetical protein
LDLLALLRTTHADRDLQIRIGVRDVNVGTTNPKTQDCGVFAQLRQGIRYLDIRVDMDGDISNVLGSLGLGSLFGGMFSKELGDKLKIVHGGIATFALGVGKSGFC